MTKATLRNTIRTETEVLQSDVETRGDEVVMVTNIKVTTRTYDGRGFAKADEAYQTIVLPIRQVENLMSSLASGMTYVLSGDQANDGYSHQDERFKIFSIRHFHDTATIIGHFYSWNEAREYVTWAKRLGIDTKFWALYNDERDEGHNNPVDYLSLEQTR